MAAPVARKTTTTKGQQITVRVPAPYVLVHTRPQVDVDKPLGMKLAQSTAAGGGIVVKSASGNAKKAGIESGDTIIYCSSYFGDELWCVYTSLACVQRIIVTYTTTHRPVRGWCC